MNEMHAAQYSKCKNWQVAFGDMFEPVCQLRASFRPSVTIKMVICSLMVVT